VEHDGLLHEVEREKAARHQEHLATESLGCHFLHRFWKQFEKNGGGHNPTREPDDVPRVIKVGPAQRKPSAEDVGAGREEGEGEYGEQARSEVGHEEREPGANY